MRKAESINIEEQRAGVEAAWQVVQRWPETVASPELPSDEWANAAIETLGDIIRSQPALVRAALGGAETAAASLSPRTFQGILECLQNADDLGATELRVVLRTRPRREVLIVHNGVPVSISHVAAMALPWVSTKVGEHQSSGRFGIGQKTLKAMGSPFEIHSAPFHFRLFDDGPRVCPAVAAVEGAYDPDARDTMVLVPLRDEIADDEIAAAVADFGVRSLIFLRSVRRIAFHDLESPERSVNYSLVVRESASIELSLGTGSWEAERLTLAVIEPADCKGHYERYMVEHAVPSGESRRHKATGATTPLGLCISINGGSKASLYDRVPLPVRLSIPMSLNAQFDPDSARSTILEERWNEDRLADLGRLVGSVALYAFEQDPTMGWMHVPLQTEARRTKDWIGAMLQQKIVHQCQTRLLSELLLGTESGPRSIAELVYEDEALESLLSAADQQTLAPGRFMLSRSNRDADGRWRHVLGELGRSLRLSVEESLRLFDHPDHLRGRDPRWFVDMGAAAAKANVFAEFLTKASILLSNGRLVACPARKSSRVLVINGDEDSLGFRLGLVLKLHSAYLEDNEPANTVRAKLIDEGVLMERCDEPDAIMTCLARHMRGVNGDKPQPIRLDDRDLMDVRDAWSHLSSEQQSRLGPKIGRGIAVRVFSFDQSGKQVSGWAPPSDAYLPAAIDRETVSFAKAAAKTRGIKWVDPLYATLLRTRSSPTEVGAQKLFVALGAAREPRLIKPPGEATLGPRDLRPASYIAGIERPELQLEALRSNQLASHLLDDHLSPDLQAVVSDIVRAPSKNRVKRSLALLSVLSRAWERRYADCTTTTPVYGSYGHWQPQGKIVATWLAYLSSVAWLPNGNNVLKPPRELLLPAKAPAARGRKDRALHLTSAVDSSVLRTGIVAALGVRAELSAAKLVDALRTQRSEPITPASTRQVLAIYQRLAMTIRGKVSDASSDESMTLPQLRNAFRATTSEGGLLLVGGRWFSPEDVLRGPPVFGRFRTFAPNVEGLEPLWDALQVPEPSLDDCIDVLRKLSSRKMSDETEGIMVSTLRALSAKLDGASAGAHRTLQRLSLWTGTKWSAKRPAYLIDEPIATCATEEMTVWKPGLTSAVDLDRLSKALGVTRLRLEDFSPVSIGAASFAEGAASRAQFVSTILLLQEALQRADLALYDSLAVTWEELIAAYVVVDPDLEISHRLRDGTMLSVPIRAHMSRSPLMFAARSLHDAAVAEYGGQAVASLFSGDRQKVAWGWVASWAQAEAGGQAHRLIMPSMKAEPAETSIDRLLDLQGKSRERAAKQPPDASGRPAAASVPIVRVRKLRNLDELLPDEGSIINAGAKKGGIVFVDSRRSEEGGRIFSKSTPGPDSPPERAVLPSSSDREDLALDAVRQALRLDPAQICDIRNRRGLGVDAIDELRQCYEIKMTSSAALPSEVVLTANEVEAARSDPDFFLAIVTGLEEGEGEMRVRFIFDPLNKLSVRLRGDLILTGVDEAEALEYRFRRAEISRS